MPSTENMLVPLDNFGSVNFTNASTVANGSSLTIASSGATALNMLNDDIQALAVPSGLGSDGSSFTVTRTQASSSAANNTGFFAGTIPTGRRAWRTGVGIRDFSIPVVIQSIIPPSDDDQLDQLGQPPQGRLVRSFNIGGFSVQIYQANLFKIKK